MGQLTIDTFFDEYFQMFDTFICHYRTYGCDQQCWILLATLLRFIVIYCTEVQLPIKCEEIIIALLHMVYYDLPCNENYKNDMCCAFTWAHTLVMIIKSESTQFRLTFKLKNTWKKLTEHNFMFHVKLGLLFKNEVFPANYKTDLCESTVRVSSAELELVENLFDNILMCEVE